MNDPLLIAFAGQFFAVFIFFIRNESRLTAVETKMENIKEQVMEIKKQNQARVIPNANH